MKTLAINDLTRVVATAYQGEQYLVRDNGAIYRIRRTDRRKRPLDEVWTFGRQCKTSGYMKISGIVVHKIVATAFYGEQPSPHHVVDHLDTNRRNNRMENLRWVTRRENIEDNPKTRRRIEQIWGSIEAMLQDPNRAEKVQPLSNRPWMPRKVVTVNYVPDIDSLTPLAMQRNWRTPSAFPSCPGEITDQPLKNYLVQLQEGSVFSHNKYGESLVDMAALSEDELCIGVITSICNSVKGWGLTKITYEGGKFVHAAQGTFFTYEGAEKKHYELICKLWEAEDSFDDYC